MLLQRDVRSWTLLLPEVAQFLSDLGVEEHEHHWVGFGCTADTNGYAQSVEETVCV